MRVTARALLCLPFLLGAMPCRQEGRTDQEKIQGTWKIVAGEYDGASIVPAEIKDGKIIITADKLTFAGRGPDETVVYKLDPGKKPRTIDLIDAKTKDIRPGIYQLDGDDLKVCYRTAESKTKEERPKDFSTGPKREQPGDGPGLMLLILVREKK